jgi:hypothetical protein
MTKKIIVISLVGAFVSVVLENLGVYDKIVAVIPW